MHAREYEGEIQVKIKFLLPSLTKTERIAANYVLEHWAETAELTLEEFCSLSGSSQASTIRFCQKLGISGFTELKQHLLQEVTGSRAVQEKNEILPADSFKEIMEKVFHVNIRILMDTLQLVTPESEEALELLLRANSITFFGVGDAAVPCYYADIKFKRIGIRSQVHLDPDIQLAMASQLSEGDVAIAISHSGRTRTVVEAMRIAKEGGASTICITKHARSPLINHCDIKLFTATSDETVGKEIIARRVAEQAILESLYLGLLTKKKDPLLNRLQRASDAVQFNKM